jgi:putative hydrolase of the HAD superfamily
VTPSLCIQELGIDPSEAVYVGDDWRIDVCGSRDAGLNPVWIKHESVKRNYPEVTPGVPVITRLDQLHRLELLRNR